MNRSVYVDGQFCDESEAKVSIFDRGFLMADGVYEVTAVVGGKLVDFASHMTRLSRSLAELEISNPMDSTEWLQLHRELVLRNRLDEGIVYLQVTRGNPGDRDFVYPSQSVCPTVIAFTQAKPNLINNPIAQRGWKVISVDDLRWARRDVKTTQLLYPCMAKMAAIRAGADDAWLVSDGWVTEGSSNNAYIVRGQQIFTRQLNNDILHGITRAAIVEISERMGLSLIERAFSLEEAYDAEEAFITSASTFVMPVIQIDDQPIGNACPGPITLQLRSTYIQQALANAI